MASNELITSMQDINTPSFVPSPRRRERHRQTAHAYRAKTASAELRLLVLIAGILASLIPHASYAAQPGIPRPSPAMLAQACAGCHGTFGRSRGAIPSINGKQESEFIRLMRDFRSGKRSASVMNRIAPGYTDEDFKALAQFYKDR
jgi:sulfide dehydrogenase cytochrome subunit